MYISVTVQNCAGVFSKMNQDSRVLFCYASVGVSQSVKYVPRGYTILLVSPQLSWLAHLFCLLRYQVILIEQSRSAWELLLNFIFSSLTTPQARSIHQDKKGNSYTLHTPLYRDKSLSYQYINKSSYFQQEVSNIPAVQGILFHFGIMLQK
jgi:hypothetical protein